MDILYAAKKIWDYHHMNHRIEKADLIMVLGSNDTRVAERGAELFLNGWAPIILFSGYLGALTLGKWDRPEAEIFAQIAIDMGVPENKILIENQSTNTGENILFSRKLMLEKGIKAKSIIAVQKPYMERRTFATIRKIWPEIGLHVTSPQISFKEYPNNEISMDTLINTMVGDLQRIILYPGKGFQIEQEVPEDVFEAYQYLVDAGYTKHMIKE